MIYGQMREFLSKRMSKCQFDMSVCHVNSQYEGCFGVGTFLKKYFLKVVSYAQQGCIYLIKYTL